MQNWHDSNAENDIPAPTIKCSKTSESSRNTTSSDARINVDLNDDLDDDALEFTKLRRPMRRDAAKRKGKATSSSAGGGSESSEDVALMRLEYERYNLSVAERIELDRKALEEKTRVQQERERAREESQRALDKNNNSAKKNNV